MTKDWTQKEAYKGFPAYSESAAKKIVYGRAYGMGEVKLGLLVGEYPLRA